ncbi:MAG: hemerythrin domain-containing protein, partial [Firmicutes bacterium]|nr:hemerythrin domain-containing protein [Bacillota bacterium]
MGSRTPDKVWAIFEEDHDHLLRILDRMAVEAPADVVAEEAGFAGLLSRHFRDEEEILLPFLEQHGEDAENVRHHVAEHLAILRLNEQVLEYARAGLADLARQSAA